MKFPVLVLIFLNLQSISAVNYEKYNPGHPPANPELYYNSNSSKCPSLHSSRVKRYELVFSYKEISPDNFKQRAIVTNGKFPGPEIRVRQYDTLIIKVVNLLDKEFALHFHGIRQKGTVRSDGVPYITQKPIQPNGTYYHYINIDSQTGTYMYHAHTSLDLLWAFGPFIIEESRYHYDFYRPLLSFPTHFYHKEITIILSQCWHVPSEDMFNGLSAAPFEDIPDTDSLLFNGRSYGEWGASGGGGNSKGFAVFKVIAGLCYRFRLIGFGSDSMIRFYIENHFCTIIEEDGIIVNPVRTGHLNINSAQRYSCVFCMNQPIGNYYMHAEMIEGPGPKNGLAILHYEGAPDPTPLRKQNVTGQTEEIPLENPWVLNNLHPFRGYYQEQVYTVPLYVNRTIIIKSFQDTHPNGSKSFNINGQFVEIPKTPLIDQIQFRGELFAAQKPYGVFEILKGENIQIVFVNIAGADGSCEQHPWHLHGRTFHIVGEGSFDYRDEIEGRNIQRRVIEYPFDFEFRDVLTLFPNPATGPYTPGRPCGWIAIRFKVDNPGIWLVHCHLTAHMIMGKRFELYEHTKTDPFLHQQCYST